MPVWAHCSRPTAAGPHWHVYRTTEVLYNLYCSISGLEIHCLDEMSHLTSRCPEVLVYSSANCR